MDFKNRIKGTITQTLVQALLHDVKNRVVPLGIEEIIREVNALDVEAYGRLDLPQALRKLPDFFVTTAEQDKGWLLEVKYRKRWNENVREDLGNDLLEQVKIWSPLHLVLFVGEPARNNDTPANYLGVCKLVIQDGSLGLFRQRATGSILNRTYVEEFLPWSEVTWENFRRFQDVFPGITDAWENETLIQTIRMMKGLYDL